MTSSTVRVTGKLTCEPEVRKQYAGVAAGRYTMTLRLRQEQGLPYIASIAFGDDPTEWVAANRKAAAMSIGQIVTVTGTHLDLTGARDGAVALLIQGVRDITPQIPAHHSEPTSA